MNSEEVKHHRKHHINIPDFKFLNYLGVFIIAGLLASGVLIVRNVNKEYEIRSIAGKFQEFKYATLSFNNIYSGLPGDITNATFYWKDVTSDGNGDRRVTHESGEGISAFQQLELAKLVSLENHMSGKWDEKKGEGVLVPGVNVPDIRDKETGFFFIYNENIGANVFGIGQTDSKPGILAAPALTPNNAYMLDLMIDDGYPDKGNVLASPHDNSDDCFAVGEYKKEAEVKECLLLFKL